MKHIRMLLGGAVACVGLLGQVSAEVVAGWDLDGVDLDDGIGVESNVPPYTLSSTTSDVTQVDAQLMLGSGVNPSTTAGQYGFKISSADQTNSLAGAIAAEHYIECALSIDSGYRLNLESIELLGQSSSGGSSNVVLMTSIDGFAAGNEIASAYPANETGGFDTDASGFGMPIDLSAVQYQNLTGSVSFRLYGWNSTSGSSPTYIRNLTGLDLVVYGSVEALSGNQSPALSIIPANGMAMVTALIEGGTSNYYVLQSVDRLSASNGWSSISAPFASSTNWMFQMTNNTVFYRVIPE